MSDLLSLLIRITVGIINSVMGIFGVLSWSERHLSRDSRVGESPFDREARSWQGLTLASWRWLAVALLVIAALISGAAWWH